jgi:hypothetical protein
MADIFAPGYTSPNSFAAEKGNAFIMSMEMLAATGNSADKIYMGILPAGVRVDLVRGNFGDTGTGNTLDVGYEPAEGTLPTASLNYWWNDLDTATAAVPAAFSSSAPIMFDRPVKVVILINSANLAGTPNLRLTFIGEMVGAK